MAPLGASLHDRGPWRASLQWHCLGAGALVKDISVRLAPAITAKLRLSRSLQPLLGKNSALTLNAFTLFSRRVNGSSTAMYRSRADWHQWTNAMCTPQSRAPCA